MAFAFPFLYKNGQSLKQILAAENKKAAYESPRLGQGFPAIGKEGINGKAELDGEPKGNLISEGTGHTVGESGSE